MPDKDPAADIPHQRKEPRPDFSKPLPPKPLPKSIQQTLDSDEKLWEVLTEDEWVVTVLWSGMLTVG
jgi:fission process protein 1